jgi:hypothetical protein
MVLFLTLFILLALACQFSASSYSEPTAPIAPIIIGDDLTSIDLCVAIPQEDIEAVMGVTLVQAPSRFTDQIEGASGCFYKGPTDSDREAHFGYVVLTPLEAYDNQPLYENVDVSDIGDEAYLNNGPDARQLWVKLSNKVAFVVAFGDVPNEEGAKAIAKLLVEAIQ